MIIELITEEQYNRVMQIFNNHPNLTYQNKGYDCPDTAKWSEEDKLAHKEVEHILRKHVVGFSEFKHFKVKGESPCFRFQYDWSLISKGQRSGLPFTGVGYLRVVELYKGFDKSLKIV